MSSIYMCIPNKKLIRKKFEQLSRLNQLQPAVSSKTRQKFTKNRIFKILQNPAIMLNNTQNATSTPELVTLSEEMTSGMTITAKLVIGSLCAYLMSCDAGFRKRPRCHPYICAYQI